MDPRQIETIIERIELGETLTKICKDKSMPSLTVFYKYMRDNKDLQNRIRAARETGCFTIIDKINDDLETPQDNQHMMWVKEKLQQSRWLASKLASGVFGDKLKSEIKQDSTITISWTQPPESKLIQAEEVVDQIQATSNKELPKNS
tara:strand:+ start:17 stop:457 length:441 start_codon:yes stop_codon:yes gene_type:complete